MISKIIGILLLPLVSYAGWNAGGAGFVRDSENPWFLKNTQVVQYCIKIDEANFGMTRSLASERITQAIEYWKKELDISRTNWPVDDEDHKTGVGIQKFIEVTCSDSADVQFLLGVLPEEEAPEDWLPNSFIGIAIRTKYDQENMRGKGFIYISPGSGPLKYNNKELVDNAWALSDGHVFRVIVMHELGHLFGLSHQSGSNTFQLMHRSFPEMLLNKLNWEDSRNRKEQEEYVREFNPAIFKYRPENFKYWVCVSPSDKTETKNTPKFTRPWGTSGIEFSGYRHEFFEIPKDEPGCLAYQIYENKIEIILRRGPENPSKLLGTATLEWEESWFFNDALIAIWLPPSQKVFPVTEWLPIFKSAGYRKEVSKFKGTYISVDGKVKREIFGQARSGDTLELGGKMGEKIYLRLF